MQKVVGPCPWRRRIEQPVKSKEIPWAQKQYVALHLSMFTRRSFPGPCRASTLLSSLLPSSISFITSICNYILSSSCFKPANSPSSPCQCPGVSCFPNNSLQVNAWNLSGSGLLRIMNNSPCFPSLPPKHLVSLHLSSNVCSHKSRPCPRDYAFGN
jgi:hypothetical protein